MSSKAATATAVAQMFIASGRRASEEEGRVYHNVLASVADAELLAAVEALVAQETFEKKPPSPALLMEYVRLVRAREDVPMDDSALPEDTGPVIEADEAAEWIAKARAANRGVKETK